MLILMLLTTLHMNHLLVLVKIDSVGANGVPEWRANLYLSYGWDDHTVRAAYYYIPETAETRDANDKLTRFN